MKRWVGVGLLGVMFAFAACRKEAPLTPAASEGGVPAIRLEGTQVLVNGEVAGTTRAIEELGRLQKIDELFDRLKRDREAFKTANPSKPFPGRATLSVPAEAPALVFKSMFQTAAFAGYPKLSVVVAAESVPLQAIIPAPPEQAREPRVALHLTLLDDAVTLTEKSGATVTPVERFEATATEADLGNRVSRAVVDLVLRRDVRAIPVVDLILHTDNRTPFSRLAAVLRGLRAAHERLAGPGDEDGAFIVRLSMS